MFPGTMTVRELTALFGMNIKFHRNLKRWSQEVLAEKIGVSKNTICEIENGKKFVHAENLVKFSNIFNIEVYRLFMPKDVMASDPTGILAKFGSEVTENVNIMIERYISELKEPNS